MPIAPERAPLASERANGGMALLIIDMISAWDFPDAAKLAAGALAIAPRIAALKRRCIAAGVPPIYVNDNHGRPLAVRLSPDRAAVDAERCRPHHRRAAAPAPEHYSVLKPKHSAFFATPLDLLLRHLRVERLIVAGVASDQCIVMSTADARMRDYEVVVPEDCVAAQTAGRNRRALDYLREAQKTKTTVSTRIRLPAPPATGPG